MHPAPFSLARRTVAAVGLLLAVAASERLPAAAPAGPEDLPALVRYSRNVAWQEGEPLPEPVVLGPWEQEAARRLRVIIAILARAQGAGKNAEAMLASAAQAAAAGPMLEAQLLTTWQTAVRYGLHVPPALAALESAAPIRATRGPYAGDPIVFARSVSLSRYARSGQTQDLSSLHLTSARLGAFVDAAAISEPVQAFAKVPTRPSAATGVPALAKGLRDVLPPGGLPALPPLPTGAKDLKPSASAAAERTDFSLRTETIGVPFRIGRYEYTIRSISLDACEVHLRDFDQLIERSANTGPRPPGPPIRRNTGTVSVPAEATLKVARNASRRIDVPGFEKSVVPLYPEDVFLVDELGSAETVRILLTKDPRITAKALPLPDLGQVGRPVAPR